MPSATNKSCVTHSFQLHELREERFRESASNYIQLRMELEEAEDKEWNNINHKDGSGCGKASKVLALGKRFLVAGFIASSAPIVLPPLVVASAIGLAVSMPYALFFATHACTQNLMSKLLPTPNNTPQQHPCLNHPRITHDDDNIQQFKTPFIVTSVVFEESEDRDIDEAQLQRETKGLLERIRDEGKAESEVGDEYKDENTNDSQNSMAEAEPIGDLLIEIQDYNVSVAEDSSDITTEKIDIHVTVTQEPRALLDRPIILQEAELDNENSDFSYQESQLHEYNEIVDSSDTGARAIADDEKIIDLEVSTYSIELQEESSNVVVDEHTDSMVFSVSSVETKFRPSECSSGEDILCPSHQVVFNDEESIWKQIHVIREIIGYEGATQASCADELKALYVFTGVEPPIFLKENSTAEINEKLHFLKSIVGIK